MTVVAAMLPLVIFAYAGIAYLLEGERAAALRSVQETARATALSLDREISNSETALSVLATSQSLLSGDLQTFYRQAKESSPADGRWTVLFDYDGYQLVNTSVPFGTLLARRQHPEMGQEVMRSKKIRVTDLVTGPVSKKFVVAIDAPVPLDGGYRYTISQAYPPEYFHKVLAAQPVPKHWLMAITDRKGVIIARSHMEKEYVGKVGNAQFVNTIQSQSSGVLKVKSLEGIEVYSVFDRSALSGWMVAIGVPVSDIENTARKVVLFSVIGFLTALACAVAAAVFFGRRLVKAINQVERSAEKLGQGLPFDANKTGIAEVDHLQKVLQDSADFRTSVEQKLNAAIESEREARTQADGQNQAKDEFLAMLGHELRNPLAPISAAASLLQHGQVDDSRLDKSTAIILRQVKHMTALLDDLLDVSRVTHGLVSMEKSAVDMKAVLGHAIEQVSDLVRGKHHQLDVVLLEESMFVLGDEKRLIQVVVNLLANAAKYTAEGGQIRLLLNGDQKDISIVVADNGSGVPGDMLLTIFDLFVQGKRSIDRSQGGLGIGLSLVKRLVSWHGGTVSCASDGIGRGSEFTVVLPRLMLKDKTSNTDVQDQDASVQQALKILVVDDNEDAVQLIGELLKSYGHEVTLAYRAKEALDYLQETVFDAMLLDIGLPGMDGYELAKAVRQHPHGRDVLLIAATGYGQQSDIRQAYTSGFDHHLVKPIDSAVLLKLLASVS